jgi:cytochrome c556
MSDLPPKPIAPRTTGLSPTAQKLQAMREKAAQTTTGAKPQITQSVASFKAKDSFANTKKTTFQRKAV